jgi:hypothetical protein
MALAKLFEIAEEQPFVPSPERAVTFEAAFVIWTYNAIRAAELITPTALFRFIEHYASHLRMIGRMYQNALTEKEPILTTYTVAIADRRFANVSQLECWFDMADGKPCESCPPAFESVCYSLAVLATQEWKRITEQKEPTDGPQQANPGNTAGQGDTGDGAGDASS